MALNRDETGNNERMLREAAVALGYHSRIIYTRPLQLLRPTEQFCNADYTPSHSYQGNENSDELDKQERHY